MKEQGTDHVGPNGKPSHDGSNDTKGRFRSVHHNSKMPPPPLRSVAATRSLLPKYGRHREDIKFFQGLSFVIGSTEEEAARKSRALDESIDAEAMIAHLGGVMDIEFGSYALTQFSFRCIEPIADVTDIVGTFSGRDLGEGRPHRGPQGGHRAGRARAGA